MGSGWGWLPVAAESFARSWWVVVVQSVLLRAGRGWRIAEVWEDGWCWDLGALATADEEEDCQAGECECGGATDCSADYGCHVCLFLRSGWSVGWDDDPGSCRDNNRWAIGDGCQRLSGARGSASRSAACRGLGRGLAWDKGGGSLDFGVATVEAPHVVVDFHAAGDGDCEALGGIADPAGGVELGACLVDDGGVTTVEVVRA